VNNNLFVGGEFTLTGTDVNGFAIYDLATQRWDVANLQPLQSSSGRPVVRSITTSTSKPDTVIVAGSFAQAGSLSCQSICSLQVGSKQWSGLGNGIRGEVAAIAYAGSNQEILVASGSLALSDGAPATNVVHFSFSNNTWVAVGSSGDLPGPVTVV